MRKKISGLITLCTIALMCVSIANAAQQPKICSDIHKFLIQRQQGHEPKDTVKNNFPILKTQGTAR